MSFELDETLLGGPVMPSTKRREMVQLAIDAYGRACGDYFLWADETDPPDVWLLLDGLRLVFIEIDRWDLARLVCNLYDLWVEALSENQYDWPKAFFAFERRFGETKGFIQGREVESAVQRAVEEARRRVIVSDPDAFADRIARSVIESVAVPLVTRAQIERECQKELPSVWNMIPDGVRQLLVLAEWLRGLIEKGDGADYSAAVLQLGRAVEGLLKHLGDKDYLLSEFRRRLKAGQTMDIGLRRDSPVEQISRAVDVVATARDQAAHGKLGPYRPLSLSVFVSVRDTVFGSDSTQGLIDLLVTYRMTVDAR